MSTEGARPPGKSGSHAAKENFVLIPLKRAHYLHFRLNFRGRRLQFPCKMWTYNHLEDRPKPLTRPEYRPAQSSHDVSNNNTFSGLNVKTAKHGANVDVWFRVKQIQCSESIVLDRRTFKVL